MLGRPEMALAYTKITHRQTPVFYTLSVDALIQGVKSGAIALSSEHSYDLRILSGRDNAEFLEFGRKYLNVHGV